MPKAILTFWSVKYIGSFWLINCTIHANYAALKFQINKLIQTASSLCCCTGNCDYTYYQSVNRICKRIRGKKKKWAATWQNQHIECAPSEDSDQPGHPPSLIRAFAVRMVKPWVLSYPLSAQRRLWADWADAQADLSLRWAHSHFVGFVMSLLKLFCSLNRI